MDKARFIEILDSDSRDYANRPLLVNALLQNEDWVSILLEQVGQVDNNQSTLSVRILELACKQNLKLLLPYLDDFYMLVPRLKLEAVIRSSAKIIELLTVEFFIKKDSLFVNSLTDKHLEQFTECCFDWMISGKAIAIQAHSMYSLYLLGTKYDWVYPELIQVIEKDLPEGSMGYKNRGRKILKAIQSKKIFKL